VIHRLVPVRVDAGAWGWSLPGEGAAHDWLAGLGLAPGKRIALAGLNRPTTAVLTAAALRGGLTVVPLNRRLAAGEIAAQCGRAAIDLTIADPAHPAAQAVATTAMPGDFGDKPSAGGPPTGHLVLFTSGTTGQAKAARLGTPALSAAVSAHVAALGLTADDLWALPLPLDHVGGTMGVLRALASGSRVQLHERFDAGDFPLEGVTGASVVPTMLARLVEQRNGQPWPTTLRRLLTGGGPLDLALAARCAALGLAPSETYGLTEMGSMVTLDGHPLPGALVQLDEGRIAVGGAMRFDGYEEDGRLIAPAGAWHATGDLGAFDADGRLRVIGRVAELIVSGGENVAAPEVEGVIATHPAVAEAAVVGVPDATWGEQVAAAVVLRSAVGTAELDAFLATRLAGFKRPRRWLTVPALPRTHTGKLLRHEIRRWFA
jgi:O-succinylbenzoic acid--CoA ligase